MFPVILLVNLLLAMPGAAPLPQSSFELAVKGAGSHGTLVFTPGHAAFEAADLKKSWRWPYVELKQIRIVSPREIAFDTFEDGSRWRFGADRTIAFDVTEGAVDGGLVAFLLEHVRRPVASAVLPARIGEPTVRVAAKHVRGRKGTHGTIAIYGSGLAYETADPRDSRYWRFADIESILRTSPYKLLIDVYERGRVRPFVFDLKEPLPSGAFDYVWGQVNRPTDRTGGGR